MSVIMRPFDVDKEMVEIAALAAIKDPAHLEHWRAVLSMLPDEAIGGSKGWRAALSMLPDEAIGGSKGPAFRDKILTLILALQELQSAANAFMKARGELLTDEDLK